VLFTTSTFSLKSSGNMTLDAPKRSWKIDVEPGDDDDQILGLARLNLKSMYNDPSQMREALAWHLFGQIGIPAARHTYARVALNGAYRGLYSVIEQIDRRFLRRWFGKGDRATSTRPTAATSAAPRWNIAEAPVVMTAVGSISATRRRNTPRIG
jgi:CotH kinase protein